VIPRQPTTSALRAMVAAVTGFPTGSGEIPRVGAGLAPRPYLILYSLPGVGRSGPPFGDAAADAVWSYQLTAVGDREDQARALLDRAMGAVLERTGDDWVNALVVPGANITARVSTGDGGGDAEGGILTAAETFALHVTPS